MQPKFVISIDWQYLHNLWHANNTLMRLEMNNSLGWTTG